MVKNFSKNVLHVILVKGGENKVGPAMWGIVDRSKASSEGFAYSGALANLEVIGA